MITSALTDQTPPADFVPPDSVVRRIWGDSNMVLLIFAGAAAEFALNRAVDWLFFTGKLPRDPIGRLFSTAGYSQKIVFSDVSTALRTLDRIRAVHQGVERQRGQSIPDWAYRDVLYMLIDYSERAHRLLAGPLTAVEQHDLYDVFRRVGIALRIPDLPQNYTAWNADRDRHIRRDLLYSDGTRELLERYRHHLGVWRYALLVRVQAILTPDYVRGLLGLKSAGSVRLLFLVYPLLMRAGLSSMVQRLLMPSRYLPEVRELNRSATKRTSADRVGGYLHPQAFVTFTSVNGQ